MESSVPMVPTLFKLAAVTAQLPGSLSCRERGSDIRQSLRVLRLWASKEARTSPAPAHENAGLNSKCLVRAEALVKSERGPGIDLLRFVRTQGAESSSSGFSLPGFPVVPSRHVSRILL